MGWIIAIIVGGVAGWLASIVMRRDASMGIFWNIIVGIVGALLGNAVLAPLQRRLSEHVRSRLDGSPLAKAAAVRSRPNTRRRCATRG